MVVLVEAGADLSVKSAQGDTALHMLVLNSHSASAVARFLKAAGDRVDGSMPNANGETALELAVRYKIWHLIPALLAPPYYDPKWRNKQGDSLLSRMSLLFNFLALASSVSTVNASSQWP